MIGHERFVWRYDLFLWSENDCAFARAVTMPLPSASFLSCIWRPAYHSVAIVIDIIIIITRPKPPFGRQGLAGSWGKDKVRRVNFGVFSTSHFAHLALSSDWIVLIKCCYSFGGYILAGYILFLGMLVTGAIHAHEWSLSTFSFYCPLSSFYFLSYVTQGGPKLTSMMEKRHSRGAPTDL